MVKKSLWWQCSRGCDSALEHAINCVGVLDKGNRKPKFKTGCACGAIKHLPGCAFVQQGVRVDFSDLKRVFRKLEKDCQRRFQKSPKKTKNRSRTPRVRFDADFKNLLRDIRKLIQDYRNVKDYMKNKSSR